MVVRRSDRCPLQVSVAAPAISPSAHRLSTAFDRISSSSIRRWVPCGDGMARR